MAGNSEEQNLELPAPVEDADYEHLIEEHSHLAPPADGELLQGHVVKITPKEVIVDIGYKTEGMVPIEQVQQAHGTVPFSSGDPIDVVIERHASQPEGMILLSHEKAIRL